MLLTQISNILVLQLITLRASGNISPYYHLLLDWGLQYGYNMVQSHFTLSHFQSISRINQFAEIWFLNVCCLLSNTTINTNIILLTETSFKDQFSLNLIARTAEKKESTDIYFHDYVFLLDHLSQAQNQTFHLNLKSQNVIVIWLKSI